MMKQGFGRILNISSAAGLFGQFGEANYCAAKMGIHGLTMSLAKEGKKKNIVLNTVAPLANTRMLVGVVEKPLFDAVSPKEVTPLVAYLCH
jgi:NAD(P)-dependent dehydrogenase (short-subunit alcohol dehydrogenase family)